MAVFCYARKFGRGIKHTAETNVRTEAHSGVDMANKLLSVLIRS